MNSFRGLVTIFFFPEEDSATDQCVGHRWTYSLFATHITAAKMIVLVVLIGVVFPQIRNCLKGT